MDYQVSATSDSTVIESAQKKATRAFELIKNRVDVHFGDRLFFWFVRLVAVLVGCLLLFIGFFLFEASLPVLQKHGFSFLITNVWDPVRDIYGALPVIYGTLASSFLALFIAAPVSIGIALFLSEIASARVATLVGFLVQMLAAIPSVVYGLWGIFVLAPWMRTVFQPRVVEFFGFIPLFQGPAYGVGLFTASVILAIMVLPTISAISFEVFKSIPRYEREGALALGATRWEMMKLAVIKSSRAGVFAAIVLGLGRALGETMAVTMLIGNRAEISSSLFHPAQTMASVIANEYAEATSDVHLAALAEVGLVLFAVTFVVNAAARFIIWRVTRVRGAK